MKSSTKDKAEGTMHQVNGKIKETVGRVIDNPEMEIEGKVENLDGKIQEKVGHLKDIVNK